MCCALSLSPRHLCLLLGLLIVSLSSNSPLFPQQVDTPCTTDRRRTVAHGGGDGDDDGGGDDDDGGGDDFHT
jgi:hypothetical protein